MRWLTADVETSRPHFVPDAALRLRGPRTSARFLRTCNQRRSVSLWVAGHLIKFCDDWTTATGRPRRRWYVVHWFPEDTTHLSYSVNGRCCCGCCADSQQSRSRYLGDVANAFDCICISHLEHLAATHASLRFCLFSINVCTLEKSVRLYC